MINDVFMTFFALWQWIWHLLMPFDILGQLTALAGLCIPYIDNLLTYIGYFCYFIPWVYIQPVLFLALSFVVARMVLALFRIITDLL